jgi:hypothetical protein
MKRAYKKDFRIQDYDNASSMSYIINNKKYKRMKWTLFIFILACLTIQSCDEDGFCVNGKGSTESEEYQVSNFTGVQMNLAADVYLMQGSEQQVVIEAQPNILDEMDLKVRNGILEIDTRDCIRDHKQIRVFVTLPMLEYLNLAGSGDIVTENDFVVEDLDINLDGSGDMDLSIEAEDVNIDIDGSGSIELFGSGTALDVRIDGSGDIKAFDFPVDDCSVNVEGSGDSRVYPRDFLNVRIDGSGNVYYKGNPDIDLTINGSGDVINAN